MFGGEKTFVFWIGLIILASASLSLFSILWYIALTSSAYYGPEYWKLLTPPIVAAAVFILIGLYMMKSGVKKKEEEQILKQ
ncbi:MAG: hypothetical protein OEY22_10650 [Candidatus Bathyarchaeota archaeon]|nr:hypothetical protein [Candidatus Bathyarchaeota archaeon]MDH5788480.1 hypothetical protein [Candidatus Bathyarchaeota archaeon]